MHIQNYFYRNYSIKNKFQGKLSKLPEKFLLSSKIDNAIFLFFEDIFHEYLILKYIYHILFDFFDRLNTFYFPQI